MLTGIFFALAPLLAGPFWTEMALKTGKQYQMAVSDFQAPDLLAV